MSLQKFIVTPNYQSISVANDSAFWSSKLASVRFSTGVTSPDITGVSELLLAKFPNKIFLASGSTLWVKVDSGSGEIKLDDQILSSASNSNVVITNDLDYGEMVISNNVRATSGNFPSFDWTKVEAGNATFPDSPPQYTLYGGGNLNNWIFDSDNARLVYTGTDPQVAKVNLSMSACMETGVETYITFALRKNDVNTTDTIKTKSLKPVTLPQGLAGNVITNAVDVTLQATDVFNAGDFVDFVVFNNSDANKPIIHEMDIVVLELKGIPIPVSNNQVITNRITDVITNRATSVVTNRQT